MSALGTLAVGFVGGVTAWAFTTWLGGPIQRFLAMRGDAALMLTKHARFIPGPPMSDDEIFLFTTRSTDSDRGAARTDMRDLGNRLCAFWLHERLAVSLLKCRFDGERAGRAFLVLANETEERGSSGIGRNDIVDALWLRGSTD